MPRTSRLLPPGKLPGEMLQRLIETYRTPTDDSVIVNASYGFDAAAIKVGGETLIVKSDPITFATSDAARYLVSVNANDIACMGGIPRWMTVVGLLPEDATTPSSVEQLFSDLHDACLAEGIMLVGGHTEITIGLDRPLLIGTLLGVVGDTGLLHPGKASAGDELYLTESAGLEGTALLAAELSDRLRESLGDHIVENAASLLEEPGISVTRDARLALDTGRVTALHDPTEGGVATAIHEIAEASGLGARIDADAIPVRPETESIARELGLDPLGILSSGALLIATKPGSADVMLGAFEGSNIPISRIGTLTIPADKCTIMRQGAVAPLPRFDSDEIARALSA
jgi:hydrogenase expression/formation protein HypE